MESEGDMESDDAWLKQATEAKWWLQFRICKSSVRISREN